MSTDVFDLTAIANDTAGEPFRVQFGDEEFVLPPRMDLRAVALMSEGDIFGAIRMMFGEEQWERLRKVPLTFDDRVLQALLDAYTEHTGTSPGESPASTAS